MTYCSQLQAIALDDAFSRKRHADFERFYERRETGRLEAIPTSPKGR